MSKQGNMKTIKISLPQQLIDKLNGIKKATGINRTEHIRRGLGMYVEHIEKKLAPAAKPPSQK